MFTRQNIIRRPNNLNMVAGYEATEEQLRRINGAGHTTQRLMYKALFVLDKTKEMTPDRRALIESIIEYGEDKKKEAA